MMEAVADPAPTVLCPACALREADDLGTGFCRQCAGERAAENYIAKERAAADKRNVRWRERSASDHPAALRERQRAHRLQALRPRELPDASSDPLELGYQALRHLKALRHSMESKPVGRSHLDQVEELIKALAWGPEPGSPPKAERKFSPGKIGMHNRWHRDAGKPCTCPPALAEALRSRPEG
jgi:hypothetical protein